MLTKHSCVNTHALPAAALAQRCLGSAGLTFTSQACSFQTA